MINFIIGERNSFPRVNRWVQCAPLEIHPANSRERDPVDPQLEIFPIKYSLEANWQSNHLFLRGQLRKSMTPEWRPAPKSIELILLFATLMIIINYINHGDTYILFFISSSRSRADLQARRRWLLVLPETRYTRSMAELHPRYRTENGNISLLNTVPFRNQRIVLIY